MSNEALGDRMKRYEDCYRTKLPRRVPKIIRIDGKAFHTVLKNAEKPYDLRVPSAMSYAADKLMHEIGGIARFAYIQSDECSIVINDALDLSTQPWFDNNIQKMVSVSASIFGYYFNLQFDYYLQLRNGNAIPPAFFDARAFMVPDENEMVNCMVWRQQDASRNSVEQYARSLYSHNELMHKNNTEMQEMMMQKGLNWNNMSTWSKRGIVITRDNKDWDPPIFTQDRQYLIDLYNPEKMVEEKEAAQLASAEA